METNEIKLLSDLAQLPLSADRIERLKPELHAWIQAANNLSLQMRQLDHQALMPITVFNHPQAFIKNKNHQQ